MPKPEILTKAKYLRKEQTAAEKILWQKLRNYGVGVKFRRQHPMDNFILDFYAPSVGLVIELDGSQYSENREYDRMRTEYLNSKNMKVVRFRNSEVEQDLDKILSKIKEEVAEILNNIKVFHP